MINPTNWVKFQWEHHSTEIIWAAIFGVVIGVVIFLGDKFLYPYLKKKEVFIKLKKKVAKFRWRGNIGFHPTEIAKSIKSNFAAEAPDQNIVKSLQKNNSLTTNKRFHYANLNKTYHACRFLKILPCINGDEFFFRELCMAMASVNNSVEVDMFLSLKKETNRIFSQEFVGENFPRRIPSHSISFREKKRSFLRGGEHIVEFKYEEGESLEGVKVILLEAFLLFPETLHLSLEWLRKQGAIVQKAVILFDGTGERDYFNSCGIRQENVTVGGFIDLKVTPERDCHCTLKKKVKTLKYNDY